MKYEERELKKKEEDEEAAKVYETFVASFNHEEGGKSFVSKNDGQIVQLGGKDRGGLSLPLPPPSSSSAPSSSSSGGGGVGIQRRGQGASGTGGRRQMDDFLDEIKVRDDLTLSRRLITCFYSQLYPIQPIQPIQPIKSTP